VAILIEEQEIAAGRAGDEANQGSANTVNERSRRRSRSRSRSSERDRKRKREDLMENMLMFGMMAGILGGRVTPQEAINNLNAINDSHKEPDNTTHVQVAAPTTNSPDPMIAPIYPHVADWIRSVKEGRRCPVDFTMYEQAFLSEGFDTVLAFERLPVESLMRTFGMRLGHAHAFKNLLEEDLARLRRGENI
jgi:hypothetical protein